MEGLVGLPTGEEGCPGRKKGGDWQEGEAGSSEEQEDVHVLSQVLALL